MISVQTFEHVFMLISRASNQTDICADFDGSFLESLELNENEIQTATESGSGPWMTVIPSSSLRISA